MNHLDEMNGLLYLERQLDGGQANEIAAHTASCGECRKLLRALEKESAWLREALAIDEEPVPSDLAVAPMRSAASWGASRRASWGGIWAAGFGFAVMGVYTLWSVFLNPWLARMSQAGFTSRDLLTTLFFAGAFWKGWNSMLISVEFLATAALAAMAIWLLWRPRRSTGVSVAMMTALLCLLAWPFAGRAAVINRGNPNYTLAAGHEINTDLIVTGLHSEIDGDVDGDLIVFSQSTVVNGHVKGDVIAFGQHVEVSGPVDGNVRVFSQSFTLNGSVAKNVMAWCQDLNVDRKASVGGTVTLGSNDGELNGHINGDVLALATLLDIDGTLERDATIRARRLIIGPEASIVGHTIYRGETIYRGKRQPEVSSQAKLGSPIEISAPRRRVPRSRYASPGYYWRQILFWAASLLFGLVFFWVAPGFFHNVENASRRFGSSAGVGILFLFAIPFAAAIACVTIIGLGVGLTVLVLYGIAVYSAQVFVGKWLGERLLGPSVGTGPGLATLSAKIAGRLALGLAILRLLRMVPFAGVVIGFIVVIWGLGAIVLALYGRMRPQLPVAVPTA